MGCGSCSSSGLPKGCRNNGSCGVKGCEKHTVFDWLSDMDLPGNVKPFECIEVRFKNGRKEYYKNVNDLKLYMGDVVAVEGNPGHDIGAVSLTGELVRLQMNKRRLKVESPDVKKLYRKASQRDLDLWKVAQDREHQTMVRSREIVKDLKLDMKLSDVEYQGDNAKATFYYIADERVDFRELIKLLASEFKIRVEMRQIGTRQEAGKIGGIGSCGRELCCSTWLTDFRSVNTSAARYQQLSLNPSKLAGQCGKLKCCLNYELDSYLDALKNFPDTSKHIETKNGKAYFQKMDIFKELLWYSLPDERNEWVAVNLNDAKEILALNEKGEKIEDLKGYDANKVSADIPTYENVVGQDELTRFDNQNRRKAKSKRRPKGRGNNPHKGPQNRAKNSEGNQGAAKQTEASKNQGQHKSGKGASQNNRRRKPRNKGPRNKGNSDA